MVDVVLEVVGHVYCIGLALVNEYGLVLHQVQQVLAFFRQGQPGHGIVLASQRRGRPIDEVGQDLHLLTPENGWQEDESPWHSRRSRWSPCRSLVPGGTRGSAAHCGQRRHLHPGPCGSSLSASAWSMAKTSATNITSSPSPSAPLSPSASRESCHRPCRLEQTTVQHLCPPGR